MNLDQTDKMVKPVGVTRSERRERKNDGVYGGSYKGVRMRKWGRWVAEVRRPNSRNRIWLGSYQTPEEAARAYDAAVFCLRGPSALFNFPARLPEIPSPAEFSPSEIRKVASRHAHNFPAPVVETNLLGGESGDIMEGSNGGFRYLDMGQDRVLHDIETLPCGATHFQSPRLWTF